MRGPDRETVLRRRVGHLAPAAPAWFAAAVAHALAAPGLNPDALLILADALGQGASVETRAGDLPCKCDRMGKPMTTLATIWQITGVTIRPVVLIRAAIEGIARVSRIIPTPGGAGVHHRPATSAARLTDLFATKAEAASEFRRRRAPRRIAPVSLTESVITA